MRRARLIALPFVFAGGIVLAGASSAASTQTLVAAADAYVDASKTSTSFGGAGMLVDASPLRRAYVRFDVPALDGPVTKATLRLYSQSASTRGVSIHGAASGWTESGLTAANAPPPGAAVGSSGSLKKGTWASVDVTPLVKAGGPVTFVVTTVSSSSKTFATRESGANAPRLVVETAGTTTTAPAPPPPPPPPPPTADTQPAFPIRAAFYYPWFPEGWRQLGIYPYTRYTPTLSWYDGSAAGVIQQHLRAFEHGKIEAGILSWWGQGHYTDIRSGTVLQTTTAAGSAVRWAVYYENEGFGNPTVAELQSDLAYMRDRYFAHPAFLRVGGRPVVFVYADAADGCAMADRWNQANTVGAYVVLKVFAGYRTCASQPASWHQYAPAVPVDSQAGFSYAVSPGFYKADEPVRLARDLARWRQNVRDMVASGAPWQLVTTFNEWGEGTSVESAREWESASGFGTYLDALHDDGAAPPAAAPTASAPVLAVAGDIASNGSGDEATAALLDSLAPDVVVTLGDNAYESGSLSEFNSHFAPSWGRHKAKIRPAPGNHDYRTSGASGYFSYFGGAAGDPAKGYYSYDVGDWHVVVLNTNGEGACSQISCAAGSAQEQWLRADLAANPRQCTLAYWHHPRFNAGNHGDASATAPLWQALYDANADLILAGHDHNYQRFAPMTASGAIDAARGIRSFVVGTGGRSFYGVGSRTGLEVKNADTIGVMKLTLRATSYDWQFVPEAGRTFTDTGTGSCH